MYFLFQVICFHYVVRFLPTTIKLKQCQSDQLLLSYAINRLLQENRRDAWIIYHTFRIMYRVLQTVWNTAVRTGSYLYNCNIPVDTEDGLLARIHKSYSAPLPSIATSVHSVSFKLGSEGNLPSPPKITSIPGTIKPASEEQVEAD